MLKIKRLYLYILQSFIPVFIMTFGICLFIVLMQFLWRYVQDMVGKGIDIPVLGELFSYAALMFIPLALPLAILLASLMAFGNMGENLELLAIKASGVSLLKAMRPLIIFISLLSVGMFFFQNEAMPRIQTKFYSLLMSVKQKSPELDIPEGTFYTEINNYNLFVKKKDPKTRMLHEVMIYSSENGFDNMAVIVADSAKMRMSIKKDFLKMTLFYGQQFSNFKQSNQARVRAGSSKTPPFSREDFKTKEIIIPFDANFKRMDESALSETRLSKNMSELNCAIDSMNHRIDSANAISRKEVLRSFDVLHHQDKKTTVKKKAKKNTTKAHTTNVAGQKEKEEDLAVKEEVRQSNLKNIAPISPDTIIRNLPNSMRKSILASALAHTNRARISDQESFKAETQKKLRYYQVEWYKKFTISFACIIFFFIGAPLGAIIRKGGLGMPVVISVILFIIYYIINNVGYKLARDGVWDVFSGMMLSSFVLAPLGAFLTYKAMNDSGLMNADAYQNFFKRIFGSKENRNLSVKDVVIYTPDLEKVQMQLHDLDKIVGETLPRFKTAGYLQFWKKPDWERGLEDVSSQLESMIEEMSNSRDNVLIQTISEFPVLTYQVSSDFKDEKIGKILGILVFIGFPLYLWFLYSDKRVYKSLELILRRSEELRNMITEKLSQEKD